MGENFLGEVLAGLFSRKVEFSMQLSLKNKNGPETNESSV
jgi:hypothetical protein